MPRYGSLFCCDLFLCNFLRGVILLGSVGGGVIGFSYGCVDPEFNVKNHVMRVGVWGDLVCEQRSMVQILGDGLYTHALYYY